MRIEFHPEALAEFRDAAEYYEKQQRLLGGHFTNAIEAAIKQVEVFEVDMECLQRELARG